ncbi:hypothetical protein Psyaliredsea_28910 [Psychrobacter alimentarius]
MASSGNSVFLKLHHASDDIPTADTFDQLKNSSLSKWQYEKDNLGHWFKADGKSVRFDINGDSISTINVRTEGQLEEGDKDYVSEVLLNLLKDIESNSEIQGQLVDSDPLNRPEK